jgi:putative spermidine/putrescine transport system substrate-binding protein
MKIHRLLARRGLLIVGVAALVAGAGGCGGNSGPPEGSLDRLGAPEGHLNLIALPGYVRDGSQDPAVDWVTPFERQTGCTISSTIASSPDQVLRLMRGNGYDGVAARGDVSGTLVDEDLVSPINTDLIPAYTGLFPALKSLPSNKVDGTTYGIPIGRLVNFLVWRTDLIHMPHDEPPTSNVLFDPSVVSRNGGRIGAYDSPMSIADAALYLKKHRKDLGIGDVYELDDEQFAAAIALLRAQRPRIGAYWRTAGQSVRNFVSGATIAGPAWQTSINGMLHARLKIRATVPDEDSTGISDAWMISSHAQHPTCMYEWMNYISSPGPNSALAEQTGQAPASEHACDLTAKPEFCDTYRAADEQLFNKVDFWTTPLRDCGDDRGDTCAGYGEWARAWREVTGR